jgi:hypothetical protein
MLDHTHVAQQIDRSTKQARENAALRFDMAIGPGSRSTVVSREQRIFCRMAADHLYQIGSCRPA